MCYIMCYVLALCAFIFNTFHLNTQNAVMIQNSINRLIDETGVCDMEVHTDLVIICDIDFAKYSSNNIFLHSD